MTKTATIHARVTEETRLKLEQLAHSMSRSKSFLAAEAIAHDVAASTWQIENALAATRKPDARFVPQAEVEAWLDDLERDPTAPTPKGSHRWPSAS